MNGYELSGELKEKRRKITLQPMISVSRKELNKIKTYRSIICKTQCQCKITIWGYADISYERWQLGSKKWTPRQKTENGEVNKKEFQDWMAKLTANPSHTSNHHYISLEKTIEAPNIIFFINY